MLDEGLSTELSWTGQRGASYAIVGGDLSGLPGGGVGSAICLADGLGEPSWQDPRPDPPSGDGHYFLIRADRACALSTYGNDSSGQQRRPTLDCP